MDENGKYGLLSGGGDLVLTCPGLAFDNRVHRFEVAGVGGHGQVQVPFAGEFVVDGKSFVIFDVSLANEIA